MSNIDWTIIYHTADSHICPFIHKFFYEKSNPFANILYADCRNYTLPKPHHSYTVKNVNFGNEIDPSVPALSSFKGNGLRRILIRNHDKFLRDWLRDNFYKITTNNIAFFEWDVLLNKELPSLSINGLHVKRIRDKDIGKGWMWRREALKYDKTINKGMAPFAAFYTNKDFIEQMIDARYDYLYNSNLFCEARLSLLAHQININMVTDSKIFIHASKFKRGLLNNKILTGCFHPVKEQVNKKLC